MVIHKTGNNTIPEHNADETTNRLTSFFLPAFEARLLGSMMDFAEVHSKAVMGSLLWHDYQRLSQLDTTSGIAQYCDARLSNLLLSHESPAHGTLL